MFKSLRGYLHLLFYACFLFCIACEQQIPEELESDHIKSVGQAITRSSVVARAREWVTAQMPYCGGVNGGTDYLCGGTCVRTGNVDQDQWNSYRSDCSGLVSWAWGLPGPGRTTYGFAPLNYDVSTPINAADLKPGDALNNSNHIQLFVAWVNSSTIRIIEEYDCGEVAREINKTVSYSGNTITIYGTNYTAIRYDNIEEDAPPPPTYPQMNIQIEIPTIANQQRDFCTSQNSQSIFDLWTGQTPTAYVTVKNTGTAVANNTKLQLWFEEPYLKAQTWQIQTDWRNNGQFRLNDMDAQQSIARTNPGQSFQLNLGIISPNETKRVVLQINANQVSYGLVDHPDIRAWIGHIDNYYEKSSFEAKPTNVNNYQTQNGGDLRQYYQTDIFSKEIADGKDNNCDGKADEGLFPQMNLKIDIATIANQQSDFCTLGNSKSIFDLWTGQKATAYVTVKNTGTGIATGTKLGLWFEEPYLKAQTWQIQTDWRNNGQFRLNDMDARQSVARTNPGKTFQLDLGIISPTETKRVVLEVNANQFSYGLADHPDIRAWIGHIDNFYEKSSFEAKPTNVNNYQTQNGGDLRQYYQTDIFSKEIADGKDNNCDGQVDEGLGSPPQNPPTDPPAQPETPNTSPDNGSATGDAPTAPENDTSSAPNDLDSPETATGGCSMANDSPTNLFGLLCLLGLNVIIIYRAQKRG